MLSEESRIFEGRHRANDVDFVAPHVIVSVAFKLGLVGHTYQSDQAIDLASRSTLKLEVSGLAEEELIYFGAFIFKAATIAGVAKLELSFYVFAIFFVEVATTSWQARPSQAATKEIALPLRAIAATANRVVFATVFVFSVMIEQLSDCHSHTGTEVLTGLEQATATATATAIIIATATETAMATASLVAAYKVTGFFAAAIIAIVAAARDAIFVISYSFYTLVEAIAIAKVKVKVKLK